MPIELAAVDWPSVGLLAAMAFVASLVGHILSFRSRLLGAIFAAALFAAICVFWFYYLPGHTLMLGAKGG